MSKGWKEPTLPGNKVLVLVLVELWLELEPVLELEEPDPPPPQETTKEIDKIK